MVYYSDVRDAMERKYLKLEADRTRLRKAIEEAIDRLDAADYHGASCVLHNALDGKGAP